MSKPIYYKIQQFNKISMSWVDIQKTYATIDEAIQAGTSSHKWRIMQINGKDRQVIYPSSLSV